MSELSVIGIDSALRRTGVATLVDDFYTPHLVLGKFRGAARLENITDQVEEIIKNTSPVITVAAIEGGAYAAVTRAHALGEILGCMKLLLKKHNIRILEVSPTQLKLFATGSGSASKSKMIASVLGRYHIDVDGDDNLADACALARFARVWSTGRGTWRSELEVMRRFKAPPKKKKRYKKIRGTV